MMDKERICPICGKVFAASHSQQKYCGAECRKKADCAATRRWKETHKAPPQKYKRVCPHCGGEFITTIPKKIYCSKSCQREEADQRSRRRPASRGGNKAGKKKAPSLVERYSQYRAAGGKLSYGYWVALGCPEVCK